MKKNIVCLVFSSILIFTGFEVRATTGNTVDNIKHVTATEVVDVKETPIEVVKDYPTEKWYDGVSFGGGLGAFGGANFQLGYRFPGDQSFLKNRLGFRVEYNTLSPIWNYFKSNLNDKLKLGDNTLEPNLVASNFGLNVDFYPFGKLWFLGNMRLSTGYYFGDFELGGKLVKKIPVGDKIENLGGATWEFASGQEPSIIFDVSLKDKVTGPYLGTGWDFSLPFGFKLFVDGGVVFTSEPEIIANITGTGKVKVTYTDEDTGYSISEEIDLSDSDELKGRVKELQNEFDKKVKDYKKYMKYFPMVKVGLIYRF